MTALHGAAGDLVAAFGAASGRLQPFYGRLIADDAVRSTNDEGARLAAHGAPEGTIVAADAQTGGRGRSGRSWFSPPGSGLYLSIVLRPSGQHDPAGAADRVRLITLVAGVAVAEGIRLATGLPAELKWPNDVGVCDAQGARAADRRWRKMAGILAEAAAVGSAIQHVIVGVGINVGQAAFPPEVAAVATSLEAESARPIDRGAVFVEVLAAFRSAYADLREGRSGEVLARWRALSPTASGARVALRGDGAEPEGVTAGLGEDGALHVRIGGRIAPVVSGELRWI